ncbi:ras GTPase-activating protein 3 isoform X1 [Penaeus vannamei]|uniref:Ras GTPase-activating protein 3 n=1 Tax=Penaeus vannamei TaxID=6689 RepID=A0A423U074_PENVA|nr:ras GTPase-activating protein 3-like isoform X1 [Penaeus vannamei]ROT82095.1 Ras GTPase-activating protein 3 [Penaeus vannamei]
MAASPGLVRLEQRLKVKIGEAKNLVLRNHGNAGPRDVYCTISLDQEEIFRSATAEKTQDLSAFFGEEFQFDIPREFRFLSFYLYDRDRPMKTDKIMGKVSIKKDDLHKYHGKDQWFPITPVDADSEVQGKVHVEVKLLLVEIMNDGYPQHMVSVKIQECSDLAIINGCCDPFATVTMHYTNKKQESKRTKVKKKTTCPNFNETFIFEQSGQRGGSQDRENMYSLVDEDAGFQEVRVALWHDCTGMFGNVFLGEVKISLGSLSPPQERNAWYFLQPRDSAGKHHRGDLGTLRLNLHYTSDYVFSSQSYDSLRNLILQSAAVEPITSSVAWLMGEVVSQKQDVVQPLTRVFLHHGQVVPFISALAKHEISKITDTNTIFRGNTLVSKCIDELMKLVGHHYLRATLKPTLDLVLRERKPCEIDPTKMQQGESRETNLANLKEYISMVLKAIMNSALSCPPVMCQIFSELRELANIYFPNEREVRYSAISGFVFLRFFAPAILYPKLFDLTTEQTDPSTHRTLTLLSKTVQSVGNLVSSKTSNQNFRETYMREVFSHCVTDKHVEGMRTFLDIISQMPNGNQKAYDTPIILKEGKMVKRAQGRKKFGIKNFKSRFFRLTTHSLTYSKTVGGRALCSIPVDDILAVERVEESSFKCKNMFQLVQPHRTLYIQAMNCVEEKEWLDLLTKVCLYNSHRLKQYHPGAYINSNWLCCKATSEQAPGCSAVSNYMECDLKTHIDSDREMERLRSLLMENMPKLEKLHKACESAQIYGGSRDLSVVGGVLDDPVASQKSISQVIASVIQLQQEHKNHERKFLRTVRYGSKQAPIGDDNYLLLASSNAKFDSNSSGNEMGTPIRKTSSSPC